MVVVAFGCSGDGGMGEDAGADGDVCATCDDGLYCNGEESCVEREVFGLDVGLIVPSIPAPPEGRRTLLEVWARVAGTPTIVAREHLWVFRDQYSLATLPPLRADSPTP